MHDVLISLAGVTFGQIPATLAEVFPLRPVLVLIVAVVLCVIAGYMAGQVLVVVARWRYQLAVPMSIATVTMSAAIAVCAVVMIVCNQVQFSTSMASLIALGCSFLTCAAVGAYLIPTARKRAIGWRKAAFLSFIMTSLAFVAFAVIKLLT
ncbi:MAG: hypothetical protein IT440_12405 [Phycisphaeraceae bacterium]|nr:hypothetical protein [Phycisphaeraceae bacterium]